MDAPPYQRCHCYVTYKPRRDESCISASEYEDGTLEASIFSPDEMNFSGLLTTERMEMAALPRVSPSSFVSTTPS